MKELGKSGVEISPLVLGGNVFGWTIDEATSFKVLDAFVSYGFNCIDTADIYATWAPGNKAGISETIIGKWLKQNGNRDKVVIATKVGKEMGPGKKGLSKSYIHSALDASLKRLQTDYVDLYQSHEDDPHTPLQETLEAYAELIDQGKVRAIGASNFDATRLSEALQVSKENGLPSYQSLQPLFNLYDRADFEGKLETACTENNIGVIPYSSLASGFLTGKYRSVNDLSKSPRGSGIGKKYLTPRGNRLLNALDQIAEKYGSSPAKVALAWLMARPSVTAPIVSATNLSQLNDIIDSTKLHLDSSSIEVLNQI